MMRALSLALLLLGAQPALADGAKASAAAADTNSPYADDDAPPGATDVQWTTAEDLVADCQHASPNSWRCDDMLIALVKALQDHPRSFCPPSVPDGLGDAERTEWFHARYEQPVFDWLAAAPVDVLKEPWQGAVVIAAQALWPCS